MLNLCAQYSHLKKDFFREVFAPLYCSGNFNRDSRLTEKCCHHISVDDPVSKKYLTATYACFNQICTRKKANMLKMKNTSIKIEDRISCFDMVCVIVVLVPVVPNSNPV